MKAWMLAIATLVMVGCSSKSDPVRVFLDEPAKLELARPEPLRLELYSIEVRRIGDQTLFTMSETDFAALERNMEAIQGRLELYGMMLERYRDFYETPRKTDK